MISNEIFERNLQVLGERFPDTARLLKGKTIEVKGIRIVSSRSGRPYLRLTAHGVDQPLEDEVDPARQAKEEIARCDPEARLAIIKGSGSGYLLRAALAGRRFARVVLVEPEPAFFGLMLAMGDLRRALSDPRLSLYVGPGAIEESIRGLRNEYNFSCEPERFLVVLPPYVVLRHPAIGIRPGKEEAWEVRFRELAVTSDRNRATLDRFVDVWREHIWRNLPAILRSAPLTALEGVAKRARVPVILVGAGPSLDRNVSVLKEYADRVAIIAVDTALRSLVHAGIEPHFVIAVDATEENVYDFDGLPTRRLRTALVMVPVVHPRIPEFFERRFVASYGHPVQNWIEESLGERFGSLLVSGSVSTIGYDLARYLGGSPIILMGMDLAYGMGTHASGAREHVGPMNRFESRERNLFEEMKRAKITRPGWGGGTVATTLQMVRWAEWFEREVKKTSCRTINATEGGMRIAGAVEISLERALKSYAGRNRFSMPRAEGFGKAALDRFSRAVERLRAGGIASETVWRRLLLWESAVRSEEEQGRIRKEIRRLLDEYLAER